MPETRRLLLLYTGGTIGMRASAAGYVPAPGALQELLRGLPTFHDPSMPLFTTPVFPSGARIRYDLRTYEPLIDSSWMNLADHERIARDVYEAYDAYDGFVVLHGTDTMAYTAASLSFMLEGLGKPVILTGSQIPITLQRNDATDNLLGAMMVAAERAVPEVCVWFANRLLRGNRARKLDTDGLDAFQSPNAPPLAQGGVDIRLDAAQVLPMPTGPLRLRAGACPEVVSLRLFPGIDARVVRNVVAPPARAVVIEAFGSGNAPDNRPELVDALAEASARGAVLVVCTQCVAGTVNRRYASSSGLARAGAVSGGDLTPEAALMKLSWLLGQGLSPDEVRAAVGTSLRGEITEAASTRWSLDDPRFAAAIARVLGAPDPGAPVDGLRAALLPSLLGAAATHGDVAALRLLLSAAGAVNLADADGRTALHRAAAAGHLEVVHALLKAGADPFVLDQRGRSSLTEAYERGHAAIIDALVAAGASVRADDLDLALRGAARRGSAEATRALLDAGADPSAADTLGRTALHLAGLAGCAETWALLVDGGADLTRTDRFGQTAEQLAASVGHRLGRNGPAKS